MRYTLLENPSAGRRGGRAFVEAFARALLEGGHEVTHYVGEKPGDLARYARTLDPAALDAVLVAGGDGTLRSVLNASETLPTWPVGMVPVGTANLVGRETRVLRVRSPRALAARVPHAVPWAVDLLEVRRQGGAPEHAISSIGAGLDGELVRVVSDLRGAGTRSGGYQKWIQPLLETLGSYAFEDLDLEVDGGRRRLRAPLAIVQNSQNYGGLFRLSPAAKLDSGTLELVVITARTRRDVLRIAVRAAAGTLATDRHVEIVPCQRVRIRAKAPVAVQADGDPAGHTDLDVRLCPKGLTLLRLT